MPVTPPSRLREMGFHHTKAQDIRKQIEIETYIQEMAVMGSKNEELSEADRKAFSGCAHMVSIRLLALRAALGTLGVPKTDNETADTPQTEASVSSS